MNNRLFITNSLTLDTHSKKPHKNTLNIPFIAAF